MTTQPLFLIPAGQLPQLPPTEAATANADVYAGPEAQAWARLQLDIGAAAFELAHVLRLDPVAATEMGQNTIVHASQLNPEALTEFKVYLNAMLQTLVEQPRLDEYEHKAAEQSQLAAVLPLKPYHQPSTTAKDGARRAQTAKEDSTNPNLSPSNKKAFIAPTRGLTDSELLEAMITGDGLEAKLNNMFDIGTSLCAQLDGQNPKDDNVARGVVLLLRARAALLGLEVGSVSQKFDKLYSQLIDKFILNVDGYIRKIVCPKAFPGTGHQEDDLVNEGRLGLLEAMGRFDLGTTKYNVLAYCSKRIHGSAVDAIRNTGSMVRVSRQDMRLATLINKEWSQGLEYEEKMTKISHITGVAEEELWRVWINVTYAQPHSFDEEKSVGFDRSDSLTYEDSMADESVNTEINAISNLGERSELDDLIDKLPERESQVVKMYYGYPPYEQTYLLWEIGEHLGVTESNACRILQSALSRLRERLPGVATRQAELAY